MAVALATVALTLTVAGDRVGAVAGAEELSGITFGLTPHGPLRLDAVLPRPQATASPAVVLVHGGGWRSGTRQAWLGTARLLAAEGYAAFTVDYRLSPTAPFPAAVDDVEAAVAYVRTHAATYRVDPARIVLMGGSAGAHLALLAGLRGQGPAATGARVSAVVAFSPPTDLTTLAPGGRPEQPLCAVDGTQCRVIGLEQLAARWLGCAPDACPERAAAASPLRHVDATDPPVWVVNGSDEVIPLVQARAIDAALRSRDVGSTLVVVPGRRHASQLRAEVWAGVVRFLAAVTTA